MWSVCGGFLIHFIESNYLGILLKANYEKPIDTAQDFLDRGIRVLYSPNSESMVEIWKNSEEGRRIAESTYIPKVIFCYIEHFYIISNFLNYKDMDEYDEVAENAIRTGSFVIVSAFLDYELEWATKHGTRWYKSKSPRGGDNPFVSFMMNKKWTLEEEFNNHMLRLQQVAVSFSYIVKLNFNIPGRIGTI